MATGYSPEGHWSALTVLSPITLSSFFSLSFFFVCVCVYTFGGVYVNNNNNNNNNNARARKLATPRVVAVTRGASFIKAGMKFRKRNETKQTEVLRARMAP